jgi:hypothetical protein
LIRPEKSQAILRLLHARVRAHRGKLLVAIVTVVGVALVSKAWAPAEDAPGPKHGGVIQISLGTPKNSRARGIRKDIVAE